MPYEIITDGSHIIIDAAPVAIRGEDIQYETLWQGRQWAATEYGIQARDGSYAIAADRLSETREVEGEQLPDWPLHMAEKAWVNIDDFCTAFLVALTMFPEEASFGGTQIREAVRRALKMSKSRPLTPAGSG